MEKVNPAGLTLDDIVFENRNKAYGAYALRQSYSDTMIRAMVISPLLAILLIGSPIAINNFIQSLMPPPPVVENPFEGLPPENNLKNVEVIFPERPKPAKPAPRVKMAEKIPLEATPDNLVDPNKKITKESELENAIAGPITSEGEIVDVPPLDIAEGTGEGTALLTEPAKTEPEIFINPEEMPEFPGGQAALMKFISKHLRFPESARRNGVNGVVYISFVIDPLGKVTRVEVLKGIDTACDAEAVRVVSKLPAWKPGRQSGRAVPVRYSIPLRFTIQ